MSTVQDFLAALASTPELEVHALTDASGTTTLILIDDKAQPNIMARRILLEYFQRTLT